MTFDIQDMKLNFNTEFVTTSQGYLKPIIWATELNWGETTVYHDNFLLALMFDQWIKFTLIIMQNSMYFMGNYILNGMLEPPLTQFLNFYQVPLHLNNFFPGQDATADFFLDMRHQVSQDPVIGTGHMDFFFLGEMIYKDQNCGDTIVDNNIHFYNVEDES